MKIIDIKSLPDLINYYGAKDKDGDGKLTTREVSAYTLAKYDISRDGNLSPWEIMKAVNRYHAKPIFKYRDVVRLRRSKHSPFPLLIKLKSDTKIQGIKYKRGHVFIGKRGKVLFGVLAAKTAIQGRSFPAGTKVFFYESGKIKAAVSPVDVAFKLRRQEITVKAGSTTEFYREECRIKSAVPAKQFLFTAPSLRTLTIRPGTKLSFRIRDGKYSLDISKMLKEALTMLRHKSADKRVKGLELIELLAKRARYTDDAVTINDRAWKDIEKLSTQSLKKRKSSLPKLILALAGTLHALAGNSITAKELLDKLVSKVLLKNHDPRVRLAAISYLPEYAFSKNAGILTERFKVETDAKILAKIISSLANLTYFDEVRKLYPQVKKLSKKAASDKDLKRAIEWFSSAMETRIQERRAFEKKCRRVSERHFLRWGLNFGYSGGLMARHGSSFETAGMSTGVYAFLNRAIWLSRHSEYLLSASVGLKYEPAILHWKRGWYSLGFTTSFRINLSKLGDDDENWKLSIGPGFSFVVPIREERDYGPSISAGIFFKNKSARQLQLYGPELQVTYFANSKEASYLLSFKYMWGF